METDRISSQAIMLPMNRFHKICSDEDTPKVLYPSLKESTRDKISGLKSKLGDDSLVFKRSENEKSKTNQECQTMCWDNITFIFAKQLKIDRGTFSRIYKHNINTQYKVTGSIFKGKTEVNKTVSILTGSLRAVKTIQKQSVHPKGKQKTIEYTISKAFDHPNILKTFEMYHNKNSVHIISEYLAGPDLFILINEAKKLDELTASRIFYQLATGLYYLHKRSIAHRDLKPENIMFQTSDIHSLVKIIDFEFAVNAKNKILNERKGTLAYVAPEVLNKAYGLKCDIWSLGIILHILLCKFYLVECTPYKGLNDSELFLEITNSDIQIKDENLISREANDLIKNMLNKDPTRRFSAIEVLRHPWVMEGAPSCLEPDAVVAILRRLKRFKSNYKFSHIMLFYTASTLLTSEQIQTEVAEFRALDRNSDGRLNKSDFLKCMKPYKEMSKFEVNEILKNCSLSGMNDLSFSEYLTCAVDWTNILNEEMLRKVFNSVSRGSSRISKAKLKRFLKNDVEELMAEIKCILKKELKRVRFK